MRISLFVFLVLVITTLTILSCSKKTDTVIANYSNSDSIELKGSNKNKATDFLRSLNAKQRKKALMPLDDASREKWHYLPSTMFDRGGIALHELEKTQKDLAFELLKSHLSKTGYDKVLQIIDLENVLAELTGNSNTRDPEKYSVAIYGDPSDDKLWAWSFEGHHISLNFTITEDKTTIVPRFLGANPATIQSGKRKGERTLAEEQDLAFAILNSLTPEQEQKAVFKDSTFYDIVTRSESKVTPLETVGIKYSELTDKQKDTLQKLIGIYLSAMPEKLATKRMERLKAEDLNEIHFGWAGATEKANPHYYRIQGKTFLIEFDNSQNNANHIHTVWRDFDGDFGRDLIKEHYKKSDHHK